MAAVILMKASGQTLVPGPRAGFGGNNAGGLILWWVEPPALTWELLCLQRPKVEVRDPEATDEASARESPFKGKAGWQEC